MDAGRAAHPIVGRGQRPRRRALRSFRRSFSSAIGSSRFTDFATPTSPSWTRLARSSTSCAPIATRGARSRRASARFRSCWRLPTTCSRRSRRTRQRRDAFRFGEQDRFPVELPVAAGRRAWDCRGAERRRSRRRGRGGDSAAARLAERSCATRRRASRGRSAPRTSASCSGRRTAIRISRRRSSAGTFRRTCTRDSDSSRRTRSRTCWRCFAIWRRPNRICVRRRFCARDSCGSPIPRCRRLPRISRRPCRAAAVDLDGARSRGSPRARARAAERRAMARRSSIDCRRPRCSSWCSTRPRMCSRRGARACVRRRENLKKIRAMIRRVQNRGYATMSRLAEHLERLTAGDESNAVIDAGDSVSLMTIHAAKGLEFPVVFVVNLSRGTGGRRHAIRVVSDAENGAGMAERRRFSVRSRRRCEGEGPRGDQASAVRRADARARPPVSRVRGEGRAMARLRRQPRRHPAGRRQGALRGRERCRRRQRRRNGRPRQGRVHTFRVCQKPAV